MNLRTRLSKLERNRPQPFAAAGLETYLPPDLCARIAKAQAAGIGLHALADADLEAIVAAGDVAWGVT